MKLKKISKRSLILGIILIFIAAIITVGVIYFKSKISSSITSSASTDYPYQFVWTPESGLTDTQANNIKNNHVNLVYDALSQRIKYLEKADISKVWVISQKEMIDIEKREGTFDSNFITLGSYHTSTKTIVLNKYIFSGSLDDSHKTIGHEMLHGYVKTRGTNLTNLVEEGMVEVTAQDHLTGAKNSYPDEVEVTRTLLTTFGTLGDPNPDDTLQKIMFQEGIEPGLRNRLDKYLPENKKANGTFAYLNSLYNNGDYSTATDWLASIKKTGATPTANASSAPPPSTATPGTASPTPSTTATGGANSAAPDSFGNTLQEYISNFYTWAIGIAGLLAIIMLIYAGYEYVTSSGNPEQVNQAKDIIIGAVAALALLLLASLFLRTLGVSL